MKTKRSTCGGIGVLAGLAVCLIALLAPAADVSAAANTNILLRMGRDLNWNDNGGGATIWRYHETWQTEVARTESGALARVDPLYPREGEKGNYRILATTNIQGSAFPATGWQNPDFDDSSWLRHTGPMRALYRSLAAMCVRGTFEVNEPANVGSVALSLAYRGGAVVYLNGKEVGRLSMPQGTVTWDSLAEDYPKEVFVAPGGKGLLGQAHNGSEYTARPDGWEFRHPNHPFNFNNKTNESRDLFFRQTRRAKLDIPPSALRKGTNVLAVEFHRAPAHEAMFTMWKGFQAAKQSAPLERTGSWWNRLGIEELTLTATGPADAVVGNTRRPKGLQVFDLNPMSRLVQCYYADPGESACRLKVSGAKNGSYARLIAAGSSAPITGLTVTASGLTSGGNTIPASSVSVRYPVSGTRIPGGWGVPAPTTMAWTDETLFQLEPLAPAETAVSGPPRGTGFPSAALQPIWVSVQIPRDAEPGRYAGQIAVAAEGEKTVSLPIEVDVRDWTVPDGKDFKTCMIVIQSPESVAMQYDVPNWSDAHWQLLDKSFELLARIGAKMILVPVNRSAIFGNREGMVRWTKQPDGKYAPDCRIAEKYIDVAMKHLGKAPVVCFQVADWPKKKGEDGFKFTEVDRASGALTNSVGPEPGTPEFREFMKPAFDELASILDKRGLGDSMMLGYHPEGYGLGGASKECVEDFKALAPQARWMRLGHYWFGGKDDMNKGPNGNPWGCVSLKGGVMGVFWDPDRDKPFYGWKNPGMMTVYPYGANNDYAGLELHQGTCFSVYRFCGESCLVSGRRSSYLMDGWSTRGNISGEVGYDKFVGVRGIGLVGADYWNVVKGAKGAKSLYDEGGQWGTVCLTVKALSGPGKDGPVPTLRSELLREGLQEAEARIFIQDAILDEAEKAKLGADLAKRAQALLDYRIRMFRQFSEYGEPAHLLLAADSESAKLYAMAEEVAKALRK